LAGNSAKGAIKMEYPTYSTTSLEHVLHSLERNYEMTSDEFFQSHISDGAQARAIPCFTRHTWASFYCEWRELTAHRDVFAERVESGLALA
jgi:hypothetical protein